MTEWSEWVLDHGLPVLPQDVAVGESVPVARWAGPRFGAVLHVQWSWTHDHHDDELISEIQVFDRVPDGWRCYGAQGGTNWHTPPLQRLSVPPRTAGLGGTFIASESGRSCCAIDGVAGTAAVTIEVEEGDQVIREPLDSPLGAFIVAFDARATVTVRILDRAGVVLAERTVVAGQ